MKILRKYCLYALSFCMVAVMLLVPVRVEASTQYGEIYEWTGDIACNLQTGILHLTNNYSQNSVYDESNTNNVYTTATYEGTCPVYIDFQGYDKGYVNGTIFFPITFSVDSLNSTPYFMYAFLQQCNIDGINVYTSITDLSVDSITLRVYIHFDNYYFSGSDVVPLNFDLSYTSMIDSNLYGVIGYYGTNPVRSDWAGSLTVYTDMRDIPGYDGDVALQNQGIIDGLSDNAWMVDNSSNKIVNSIIDFKNWNVAKLDQYGQGILDKLQSFRNDLYYWFEVTWLDLNNHFSNLTTNMQAWYDGLTNTINSGIDRLINNYSGTGTADASNKFNDSAGELTSIEENLSDSSNAFVNDFTTNGFDVSVLTTVGSSMTFIVTWFTNFWNMGGILTSGLNICFAIAIAFFILRVKR